LDPRCETRGASLRLVVLALPLLLVPLAALAREETAQPAPAVLSNRTIAALVTSLSGSPELQIDDLAAHRSIKFAQLFSITLRDGSVMSSARMQWRLPLTKRTSPGTSGEQAEQQVCADLKDTASLAEFHWCLISRLDGTYVRERLTVRAGPRDLAIAELRLLDFHDPLARVIGSVKGSPIADERMFFGFESPLSWSRVVNDEVEAGIARALPLRAGREITYSAVIGTFQPCQLRRAFLAYIERERPRAYKPFLNYNSWFDIGYQNRYDEAAALDRIHAIGAQLVEERHVVLDSFVFDDGWDNPSSLWHFDAGFKDGFTRVSNAAAAVHSGIGVWLSPWGGYAEQKQQRIAFGKLHHYEIINGGFALSGNRYFREFSRVCYQMIDRYHVNLFKLDGTGNAGVVFPGSRFDSDFGAAIELIQRIRERQPGIFIDLTTGTYPSPFWLFYTDSIWHGGAEDDSFAGVGSPRQRWITFRDQQTWRNVVQQGPLFPLNSIMVHGVIYAQHAADLDSDGMSDLEDEVLSYFGSGTQLQELYVTPSLLTRKDWDILAAAANWSRSHASILEDTHWIGGDPGQLQVYGWAAWNASGWILTLRNPSDHPQDFPVDLDNALELPQGEPDSFMVREPFASPSPAPRNWNALHPLSVHLKPFEVRIFEGSPTKAPAPRDASAAVQER
jgi:hypothetical protein